MYRERQNYASLANLQIPYSSRTLRNCLERRACSPKACGELRATVVPFPMAVPSCGPPLLLIFPSTPIKRALVLLDLSFPCLQSLFGESCTVPVPCPWEAYQDSLMQTLLHQNLPDSNIVSFHESNLLEK